YQYLRRWGDVMPNRSVWFAVSFIDYLVKNYDEKKVIEYITVNSNIGIFTDKKFPELIEDWHRYLEEICSEYVNE
ncbi:MAG: hypothetical protein J6B51_09470, partial [Clostridia bacterium]|nr:hypothetical protein [Clostridia bacterium]